MPHQTKQRGDVHDSHPIPKVPHARRARINQELVQYLSAMGRILQRLRLSQLRFQPMSTKNRFVHGISGKQRRERWVGRYFRPFPGAIICQSFHLIKVRSISGKTYRHIIPLRRSTISLSYALYYFVTEMSMSILVTTLVYACYTKHNHV